MDRETEEKLALFAENARAVRTGLKLQNALTRRLAALLYTLENKPVDCAAIKESRDRIKSGTSVFSMFRGNMSLCVAAMLSLREDREKLFSDAVSLYDMLKGAKFRPSDYLVVAAYQIAANSDGGQFQRIVGRTKMFYDGMKERHFFLTGQDDYIFAAMLGLSDIDPKTGVEDIERLFQRLKPEFHMGNSVQALAQVLVLGGKPDDGALRALALSDALRSRKIRLDRIYTLPALGVLALLPADSGDLARDISEARDYLKAQKSFGAMWITNQELLLFIAAAVASARVDQMKDQSAGGIMAASLSTSVAGIIIAQQTAIIVAASSGAAAASASSSSSY